MRDYAFSLASESGKKYLILEQGVILCFVPHFLIK